MRLIRLVILGLFAAVQTAAAYGGALTLKLTILDPTAISGAKIRIRMTVANESEHQISFNDKNPYCDYSVTVLSGLGDSAPQTNFKKHLSCGGNGDVVISTRNILVTLNPGESTDWDMEITELFDVSPPGSYSVKVVRTFPGFGQISSNTATVTVETQ